MRDGRCMNHPDRPATELCAFCGKPLCAACVVEDLSSESIYCSEACLRSLPGPVAARSGDEFIAGLRRPMRFGWALWFQCASRLTVQVAVPVGIAYFAVTRSALAVLQRFPGLSSALSDLLLMASGGCAMAATSVLLSRAYTGAQGNSPWPFAMTRALPWAATWILVSAATIAGSLLFVIPGILAGIRLFWADEFCLMHRLDPTDAMRESVKLTRGLSGRIFGFQFVLGLAEYAVAIPVIIAVGALAALLDELGAGLAAAFAQNLVASILLVNLYATAHAPEVVYFYGLRALRATLADGEVRGDWVARSLRTHPASHRPERCASCDEPWNPADYQQNAERISCSRCGSELQWPDGWGPKGGGRD
jgi:hypothetical protein